MRKLFLLLSLCCATYLNSFSQQQQIRIEHYALPGEKPVDHTIIVEMPYALSDIISIRGDTEALRSAGEVVIDIVCTDYPSHSSLEKLNDSRLKRIYQLFPSVRRQNVSKVNFLRQLDGSEREVAKSMFHGAVIRFRPAQTKETMKQDLEKLETMLMEPAAKSSIIKSDTSIAKTDAVTAKVKTTGARRSDVTLSAIPRTVELPPSPAYITTETKKKKSLHGLTSLVEPDIAMRDKKFFPDADSLSVMTPRDAMKKGYLDRASYDRTFSKYATVTVYFGPEIAPVFYNDLEALDSAVVKDSTSPSGYSLSKDVRLPDSTVFNVFTRNKWKNMIVVGDVTGSMYPYTAQLLLWLKLHSLDDFTTRFAFFNDGDDKPDSKKEIGKTGGIYIKRCYNFNEAKELVKSTMLKGGGGDCPENDIEALLLTEKEFPENDCQVLIADNWAPIKDKILIDKLTKPVRVVLCGADTYGINVDYLNLARKTKGSVHLMEEDLYQLASMHEGETLKIGRMSFRITDGEFKVVTDLDKIKTL